MSMYVLQIVLIINALGIGPHEQTGVTQYIAPQLLIIPAICHINTR